VQTFLPQRLCPRADPWTRRPVHEPRRETGGGVRVPLRGVRDRDETSRMRKRTTSGLRVGAPNSSRLTRAGYALKYSSRSSEPRPASRAAAKLAAAC
jgi:hypothetical protein